VDLVEATVRDVFRLYNFHEIRTPIFEETQLFARGWARNDIVRKRCTPGKTVAAPSRTKASR